MIVSNFILKFFILLYFLSFLFSDSVFIPINNFNFSISEIFFIIMLLFILLTKFKDITQFVIRYNYYNFYIFLIFSLLLIKFIKVSLNFSNLLNLYEFCAYLYMISILFIFKFLLDSKNINKNFIINIFKYIFFISSIILIFSIVMYYLDAPNYFDLWELKKTHYPYFGSNIIHWNGFLNHYNMQVYIMIPGYIFILFNSKINFQYKLFIISFFCTLLFLITVKILIIILGISFLYLFHNLFANFEIKKYFISLSLISLFILYFFLTHFLFVNFNQTNFNIIENYEIYYTYKPLFKYENYGIYGSLFFKLKYISVQQFISNGYIFFNEINFLDFQNLFITDLDQNYKAIIGHDPHSEYFGSLGNYGLIGFILIVLFFIYPIYSFLKISINYVSKKTEYYILISLLFLLIIFHMEAINTDIIHFRFYWIIVALYFNELIELKKINHYN